MSSSFPKSHRWSSEGGRMRARWLIRLRLIDSNGFGVGITTGTITINDEIITVQTTGTQATLFSQVTTADSDLSIVYDTLTDKITLASSSGSTLDLSG